MNICLLLVLLLPAMASAQTGLYVPAGGSYDVGDGTLDLASQNIYVAGDLLVGSGQLTAQDILITEGGKMVVGTGAIRLTRNWTNRGTFEAGSSTVYFDTEPSTVSTRSLAQVSGETLFWNATIAENKTVVSVDGTHGTQLTSQQITDSPYVDSCLSVQNKQTRIYLNGQLVENGLVVTTNSSATAERSEILE